MSHIRRILPVLCLCVVVSVPVWAQPPSPSPSPSPTPTPSPTPSSQPRPTLPPQAALPAPTVPPVLPSFGPWWRDSELSGHVDLDDATIDLLEKLFLEHRLRLAELAEQLDRARAARDFEHHRSEPDEAARKTAEDRVFDLRQQIDAARAELLVEIRAQLSTEQWQKLSDYERSHRPTLAPRAPRSSDAPLPTLERGVVRPVLPAPEAPPAPDAPAVPRTDGVPSARPGPAPSPAPAPAPAALPPSAPLPPAPPSLSWWTDADVRSHLDLSPQQLRELNAHTRDSAGLLGGLSERVRAEEQKLERLVRADTVDREAARDQIDSLAVARRDLLDAGRELERDLLGVLTAEQRQRLDALVGPVRRQL